MMLTSVGMVAKDANAICYMLIISHSHSLKNNKYTQTVNPESVSDNYLLFLNKKQSILLVTMNLE